MSTNSALLKQFRSSTGASALHRSKHSNPPVIGSADYVYDRVHRIEVFEEIPQQFVDVGSMDGWRQMVRAEAFKQLLDQIPCDQIVTIECRPLEKEETTPDDKRHFYVGCELRYTRSK